MLHSLMLPFAWTDSIIPVRHFKVMRREAKVMRGEGDTIFAQVKKGDGVQEIKTLILAGYEAIKAAAAST